MFRPISSQNSYGQNWNEVNNMIRQLNKEQTVKTFKQPGGNAIVTGKLPYTDGYGSLYYDSDGLARIIIGILPDGTIGIVTSKDGIDVIDDITW
jgi:hypothetical protein